MPPVRFLVPGTSGRYRCGGLSVELQSARIVAGITPTEVVTYRQREPEHPFLDDLLRREHAPGPALWIVSWGFDVPRLLGRLRGRPVAYHAHSSGYGFDLPPAVPVLAVSRNTLGYWGDRAPRNPLFLVPNALEDVWRVRGARPGNPVGAPAPRAERRPIDVLVQRRKSSHYLLEVLVPTLRADGLGVVVQEDWVDDLVGLFNSATVYLYDSADYWRTRGVSEGFGLPPLEALACGCVVFSSLNHALADTLVPGVLGHQIGCGSLEADRRRIAAAVADPGAWRPEPNLLAEQLAAASESALRERWQEVLRTLESWPGLLPGSGVTPLRSPSVWKLRLSGWMRRIRTRIGPRGRSVRWLAPRLGSLPLRGIRL